MIEIILYSNLLIQELNFQCFQAHEWLTMSGKKLIRACEMTQKKRGNLL